MNSILSTFFIFRKDLIDSKDKMETILHLWIYEFNWWFFKTILFACLYISVICYNWFCAYADRTQFYASNRRFYQLNNIFLNLKCVLFQVLYDILLRTYCSIGFAKKLHWVCFSIYPHWTKFQRIELLPMKKKNNSTEKKEQQLLS